MRVSIKTFPIAVFAAVAFLLAACETPSPTPVYPEVSFRHLPKLKLDVAAIDVRQTYVPPLKAPNVEHQFPLTPSDAARRWIDDRLAAAGSNGVATVIIQDASAIEEKLRTQGGIRGAFTTEQSERYVARMTVRLEVSNAGGLGTGFAAASAARSRTVPEDATLNERDKTFFELTEGLVQDFDRAMEKEINDNLRGFLVN